VYDVRVNDTKTEKAPVIKDEIDLWLESIPEAPKLDVVKTKVIKRYHVIGGCFGINANADKLVRRLKRKGFDPQLVGKNRRGLQRVAFGSYETRAEAKKALREVKRNHMESAWLYVSKK
jgi:cell division protein FtsN